VQCETLRVPVALDPVEDEGSGRLRRVDHGGATRRSAALDELAPLDDASTRG
jgi:hypothetical protein